MVSYDKPISVGSVRGTEGCVYIIWTILIRFMFLIIYRLYEAWNILMFMGWVLSRSERAFIEELERFPARYGRGGAILPCTYRRHIFRRCKFRTLRR